jgi:hypothetical protein
MDLAGKKNKSIRNDSLLFISGALAIVVLLAGCAANYGSLKRDPEVQQDFESQRVPPDYKYYYYGFSTRPYVVFGIEPTYKMNSRLWKEAAPDTAEFKEMIRWIWEDYGYYKFGADILDPTGKKVGVMYTAINETSVKFGNDNHIEVMPNLPFLWGPEGNIGGGARTP